MAKKKNKKKSNKKNNVVKKSNSNKKVNNNTKSKEVEIKESKVKEDIVVKNIEQDVKIDDDIEENVPLIDPETVDEQYYQILEKERSYIFLKIILFLMTICLIGYSIYKFVIWNPSNMLKRGTTQTYKELIDVLNEIQKNELINFDSINGVLTVSSDSQDFKDIEDYQFDLDISRKDNSYGYLFDINKDNTNLLSYNYYNVDNIEYVKFNNLYEKAIKIDDWHKDKIKYFKKINYSKINEVLKNTKDIINNNIHKDVLLQGQEDVTINNNNYSLKYVELTINKENFYRIVNNIVSDITSDETLITSIKDALGIDRDDVKPLFDSLLKEIIMKDFNKIYIKVYVDGYLAKPVGVSIKLDNEKIFDAYSINDIKELYLKYYDYVLDIVYCDNKINLSLKNKDVNVLNIKSNKFSNDYVDVDYNYYNQYGNFHLELKDKHGNIKFSNINDNNKVSFNYDFELNDKFIELDKNNVIDKKELSEKDYLDMYNYIKNNINQKFIKDTILKNMEALINY